MKGIWEFIAGLLFGGFVCSVLVMWTPEEIDVASVVVDADTAKSIYTVKGKGGGLSRIKSDSNFIIGDTLIVRKK